MAQHEVLDRAGTAALVPELARWDARTGYQAGLHAGDLGWHLRLADELIEGTVHGWWQGPDLVAVGLLEGAVARPRVRPDLVGDVDVAAAVAAEVDRLPGPELWADVAPGSALRYALVARGWALDPDPWVSLYAHGSTWRVADRGEVGLGVEDVPARVAVQRNGFDNSTFDEPSWHRMAAGPGFRPDLDLVVRASGVPGAGGTGWLSVADGPAVLEPLATHRDHRRQGLGRAAAAAVVDACLAAGASGVSVATPVSNGAAVATYVAAGFRPVETVQGLTVKR